MYRKVLDHLDHTGREGVLLWAIHEWPHKSVLDHLDHTGREESCNDETTEDGVDEELRSTKDAEDIVDVLVSTVFSPTLFADSFCCLSSSIH